MFFILRGKVKVFFEDGAGNRVETVLGPWDCVSCPADVIHGFVNVGLEAAYLQVMLGKARPDLMTYTDAALQQRRDAHLQPSPGLASRPRIQRRSSQGASPPHPRSSGARESMARRRGITSTPGRRIRTGIGSTPTPPALI